MHLDKIKDALRSHGINPDEEHSRGLVSALSETLAISIAEVKMEARSQQATFRDASYKAIKKAALAGMKAQTVEERESLVLAIPKFTVAEDGKIVAISLQDNDHRLIEVLWRSSSN